MKFRTRIMLSTVALMAVLFSIGGNILIAKSFSGSLEREAAAAKSSYRLITNTLHALNRAQPWEDASDAADSLKYLTDSEAYLFSGCCLYQDQSVYYIDGAARETFQDLASHTDEGNYATIYFNDNNGRHFIQLSGTLIIGSDTLKLDLLYDITSVYTDRQEQIKSFYRIYAAVLLLSLLLAGLTARALTGNLTRLSRAAGELADGNLSYRSGLTSSDEIGLLGREFDRMADELERTVAELTRTLERQEEFMGSFAHEMKTPMTSVIGYAELLRADLLDEEERIEAAGYIFSEGKRLEQLSNKLLSLFSLNQEKLHFSPVSPLKLICELAEDLNPVYEREGIHLEADGEEGIVWIEPDLTQTLLVNLIDNARKALEHGGVIHLSCSVEDKDCVFRVRDNGRGIPAASISHLTEAFYRVDKSRSRAQGGAGLGLTLCSRIAKLHHGELRIESEEGSHTTVTVRLGGMKDEEQTNA